MLWSVAASHVKKSNSGTNFFDLCTFLSLQVSQQSCSLDNKNWHFDKKKTNLKPSLSMLCEDASNHRRESKTLTTSVPLRGLRNVKQIREAIL